MCFVSSLYPMGAFESCAECVHTAQTRPISEMLSDLKGPCQSQASHEVLIDEMTFHALIMSRIL